MSSADADGRIVMGTGHKQLNPDGSLRFPFESGPPKGKYPGWLHKRKRQGRRRRMRGKKF